MQGAKIRIWRMVAESYGFLLAHPGVLFRVGWLPLMMLYGINLAFGGLDPWPQSQDLSALLPLLGLMAANVLAQSLVAAAVLVGLCIFATLQSPADRHRDAASKYDIS